LVSLLGIALAGYALGIVLAVAGTTYGTAPARRAASVCFVFTWLLHFGAVVQQGALAGRLPLTNMAEYLLVLGWAVLTLHLYVWFGLRVHVAALVLPPVAALSSFAAWRLLAHHPDSVPPQRSVWFLFHVTVSTLGMAILCVAFAMSVIYIVNDRALKSKKAITLLERLPALEKCDQIGLQALAVGFVLLTLGIGTGVIVNSTAHERLWIFSAKQVFPLLAWILLAVVLVARSALGFRGRRSAYMTIAGFALGVLTVLGMTL